MQANNMLNAPLLDIVFDGRNKNYGAYELRVHYPRRIRNAMLLTGFIVSLGIAASVMTGGSHSQLLPADRDDGFIITAVEPLPPEELMPQPEEPRPEEPQVRSEIFTAPVILDDKDVKNTMASQDALDSAAIDVVRREGTPYTGEVIPETHPDTKGILEVKHREEPEAINEVVDLDASYRDNWKKFLERNLVPEVPVNNEAPPGRYPVLVKFVVDLEGQVSDIVALTRHGYGMEEEAKRVISKSARWEPAILNGKPVKAYKKQLITFVVEGEE
ncbi:MAG: energy transducer TonB [Chitinophagaceae bacterium]|nr:energy transducer TonB [Chitinophagaceae bacterium]